MIVIMKNSLGEEINIGAFLKPETALEKQLITFGEFRQGLFWGKPRYGHPEGMVLYHIREVLDNIDLLEVNEETRSRLRIIAFTHDTFKYIEEKSGIPRDWSKHHSVLARKFMEPIINDKAVLDIIELHDEAYYFWRLKHLYKREEEGNSRMHEFLRRIGDNIQLYYLFFKCDTRTGDKIQAPLKWFEKTFKNIEVVDF